MTEQDDPIAQAQAELDAVQAGQSSQQTQGGDATPAPAQDVQAQRGQDDESVRRQIDALERQVRGLQSLVDRGLNAIRKDLTAQIEERQREALLQSVPEEYREAITPLYREIAELKKQLQSSDVAGAPDASPSFDEVAASGAAPPQADAELDRFLNGMGLSATTPGLDWYAYSRGDHAAFLNSCRRAILAQTQGGGNSGGGDSGGSSGPADVARATSPSVRGTPSQGAATATVDDVMNDYLSGKLDTNTYRERMRSLGFNV